MVSPHYLVTFPNGKTLGLYRTYQCAHFRDLPDGKLFTWRDQTEVFEKQHGTLAARLLPWDDDDYYDCDPERAVEPLMTLAP